MISFFRFLRGGRQHHFAQFLPGPWRAVFIEYLSDAHHKIVRRQNALMPPKPFADDPFHVVAAVGAFGGFFADHQTESGKTLHIVFQAQHLQKFPRTLLTKCKNGRELFRF